MAYRTSIGLDAAIAERASQPDLAPAVSALRCLRGAETVTAFLCAAPLGPRAMADGRSSPAEASECASQRADIRLAVVRRTRHANGGCGARRGHIVQRARPGTDRVRLLFAS